MSTPTEKDLHAIVNKTKNLCMAGLVDDIYCKQFNINLEIEKQDLLNSIETFKMCCEWLSNCRTTKTATANSPGSYGLKHMVEKYFNTYISNGVLIAAVLHMGIPYKVHSDPPNISVGISKSSAFYKEQVSR